MKENDTFGSGMPGLVKRIKANSDLSWLCGKGCFKNPVSLKRKITVEDINRLLPILKGYGRANVRPKDANELSGRKKFTMVKDKNGRIWPWRMEEALERCIAASKPEIGNQLPVGRNGKEAIDLYVRKDGCVTIIELKPWNSANHLWQAIVECMKNYYLYTSSAMAKENPCECAVILAPTEFYDKSPDKSQKLYKELLKTLRNSNFPVRLVLKAIDCAEQYFTEQCIAKINDDNWQPAKKTKQYNQFQQIDAFPISALTKNWVNIRQ